MTCPWRHVDVADKIVRMIGFLSAFCVELSCRVGQAAHFHHCVLMFLQFGPQGWEEGPINPVWSLRRHVIGWMPLKMRSRLVIQPCFSQLRMILPHGPNCSYFLIVVFLPDWQIWWRAARFLHLFVSPEWKLSLLEWKVTFYSVKTICVWLEFILRWWHFCF